MSKSKTKAEKALRLASDKVYNYFNIDDDYIIDDYNSKNPYSTTFNFLKNLFIERVSLEERKDEEFVYKTLTADMIGDMTLCSINMYYRYKKHNHKDYEESVFKFQIKR